jgi:hypothetical protein
MNRRAFLKRSAAMAVPVLAGCLESGPGEPSGSSPTQSSTGAVTRTTTKTNTQTETDSPTEADTPGETATSAETETPEGPDTPEETDTPTETDAPGTEQPTETDTPDSGGTNGSRLVARTLEVTTDRARRAADPTVEFDGDAVVVEGTITGNDHCYTAELDDVSHHDGELDVLVSAVDEGGDEACAQEVIEIEYRATFEFEGTLPATVVVRHDSMGEVETVARASR